MSEWQAMVFSHPKSWTAALEIAGKTAVIYLFLVGGLRLLGKRELGQMTVYDVVLMVVLANSVQNAMVGEDSTLLGGIVSATTLLILNRLFVLALERSKKLERLMVGQPVVLFHNGHLNREVMLKEGITREQVLAALREHGMERLDEAHLCVLEVDGTISVIPSNAVVHRTKRHYRALRLP